MHDERPSKLRRMIRRPGRNKARWTAALHEGAHCTAAVAFFEAEPIAILLRNGDGVSGLVTFHSHPSFDSNSPSDLEKVGVFYYAGRLAEKLCRCPRGLKSRAVPLPLVVPAGPIAPGAGAPPGVAEARQSIADGAPADMNQIHACAGLLARQKHPHRGKGWGAPDTASEVTRLRRMTQRFLRRHQEQILTIARELFVHGSYFYNAGIAGRRHHHERNED